LVSNRIMSRAEPLEGNVTPGTRWRFAIYAADHIPNNVKGPPSATKAALAALPKMDLTQAAA
jgi:hypothetical protein